MQTKQTLRGVEERNFIRQWLGSSVLALAIFMLSFLVVPYLVAEVSAATNLSAQVTWNAISLTFDPDVTATEEYESSSGASGSQIGDNGHGDIDFGSIIPTSKSGDNYGTMVITKKTLGVTTPGRYYSVYLSMASSDQNLNYTYDGNTDTRMNIPATSGTWDTPVTIVSNGQTGWGYMVPETIITKSDGFTASVFSTLTRSGVNTLFSGKLNTNLIAGTGEGGGGAAYSDSLWAAVPVLSAPQQIWKNTTSGATGFSDGEDFDIYFAVNVDTDILSGEYTGQIIYTALASAASIDSISENLIRSKALGGTGDTQTLTFDLASNNNSFVAEDNIAIYLVPHAAMVAANYNPANFAAEQITAYTASGNQCVVVANSFTISDKAEISCTLPEKGPADMDETTLGDGTYDFWLVIDNIGATYVSKVDAGNAPSFVYAGLQSVDDDGDSYVTKMQEMTPGICSNTNMWGTGVRDDARVYDYLGELKDSETGLPTATPLANTVVASDVSGLGSFYLSDNRDNNAYRIRRLADGKCWMTENLQLDLADFAGTHNLNTENTDLSARDYWDPSASVFTAAENFVDTNEDDDRTVTQDNYFEIYTDYDPTDYPTIQHYQFQPDGVQGTVNAGEENEMTYVWNDGRYPRAYLSAQYGGYYNYPATVAEGQGVAITTNYNRYDESICAKGWHLPNSFDNGEGGGVATDFTILFRDTYRLIETVGETNANARAVSYLTPFNFGAEGFYEGSLVTRTGLHTRYHANAMHRNGSAVVMYMTNVNSFHTAQGLTYTRGTPIRCVARD